MGQYRIERLSQQLQQEIATMLLRHEIKDPRVNEFLTVNRVEVAGDLSYAKVYVSSFMDDSSVKKGVEGLQCAAGFIQSTIAKKVSTYKFPKLTFVADFSMKNGYKMVKKLNELEASETSSAETADTQTDSPDEKN